VDIASRREARERTIGLLYEAEMKHMSAREVLDDLPVAPDPYCGELIDLVISNHERALEQIAGASANWPLERISVLDRLVMELALAELSSPDAPPLAVVLDEAVELAKLFSMDPSGGFVNGVLSAITRRDNTTT